MIFSGTHLQLHTGKFKYVNFYLFLFYFLQQFLAGFATVMSGDCNVTTINEEETAEETAETDSNVPDIINPTIMASNTGGGVAFLRSSTGSTTTDHHIMSATLRLPRSVRTRCEGWIWATSFCVKGELWRRRWWCFIFTIEYGVDNYRSPYNVRYSASST